MSCALFPCVAAAAAPGPASVASASDSLASDDFLTAGSASDSEPERVDPEPQIPSFGRPKIPRAAEVAASWCRQKRKLADDITFQSFVEALMVCATRWRFTDECLEMILAGFSETAQLPAHDRAPSVFKLRKMMETRSSVALQQFPVCAKECSVYPKSFDQMTAEEINNARCLVCAGRFMNVSSKNPKPEKVSLFKHLFGCAKLCLVGQALFGQQGFGVKNSRQVLTALSLSPLLVCSFLVGVSLHGRGVSSARPSRGSPLQRVAAPASGCGAAVDPRRRWGRDQEHLAKLGVLDARCSRKRSRPEGDQFRHAEQRAQHCAVAAHRRLQGVQRSLRLDDPHGVHDPQPS